MSIVTEGYMDVIALASRRVFVGGGAARHRADRVPVAGAVAARRPSRSCASTATPPASAPPPARLRRALPLLRPGHSLRFAGLPAGEDPDSLIRRAGRQAFEQVVAAARPLSQMLWEIELGAGPADTPERRADLDTAARRRRCADCRPHRAQRVSAFCARPALRGRAHPRPAPRATAHPRPGFVREGPAPPPRPPDRVQREILFRILLQSPSLIEEVAEEFAALDIPEAELDKLRREILEIEALRPGLDASATSATPSLNGFAATVDALSFAFGRHGLS